MEQYAETDMQSTSTMSSNTARTKSGIVVPGRMASSEKRAKLGNRKYMCFQCGRKYMKSAGLNRHLRKIHNITIPVITNIKCLDCQESKCFPSIKSLRLHLANHHGYTMDEERLVFTTMNAFLLWKKNMEEQTNTSYIRQRGCKSQKASRMHFFTCHRSGLYYASGTGKRSLKAQGSCKLGFSCTSSITAMETRHKIYVSFVKQHYMHSNDVSYIRLSQQEKFAIASKLLDGVSYEDILAEFRSTENEGSSEKIKRLTRKDIHNIRNNIESIIELAASSNQNEDLSDNDQYMDEYSNDNPEAINPPSPLSTSSFDMGDNQETNAEEYVDQALQKLQTLYETLTQNKNLYNESMAQEILERVQSLVEISHVETVAQPHVIQLAEMQEQPLSPLTNTEQPLSPLTDAEQPLSPLTDAEQPLSPLTDAEQPLSPLTDAEQPQTTQLATTQSQPKMIYILRQPLNKRIRFITTKTPITAGSRIVLPRFILPKKTEPCS